MLLVGMDTPQLTPELLDVDWAGSDALLGLTEDGGYWCIGLRRPSAEAIVGVPMSTERTGAEQLARLRGLGLGRGAAARAGRRRHPAGRRAGRRGDRPETRFAREHRRLTRTTDVHPMALFEDALNGGCGDGRR